ncbi:NDP-sugar synthase [Janibacter sp. LM]|uniref:NDP-sugar synthase n=1 Tax=Janibacter sp. LM TaxID=3144845 RepID=UPI0031F6AF85
MTGLDAVILAGGRGKRMLPLTADCPKPLLPVGPWTLVEHQIAALGALGVDRVMLSTGYRHEDFDEIVLRLRDTGIQLITVVEETPLGTGGGLREALKALPDAETVVVLNGDLLSGHDLAAQVTALRAAPEGTTGIVHVREVEDARAYGSILMDVDDGVLITAFVEKSATPPSLTVNAGTYVLRREFLDDIASDGEVSLEHEVFPALVDRRALRAYRENAYFLDVGSPAALVTANRDLLFTPWPGAAPTPQGPALVLPGANVDPSAVLSGGTVVHPGAVIAAGARIESALVLDDARIDAHSQVLRSVIGRRAHVGASTRLADCVLGSDVTVAANRNLERQSVEAGG